MNSKFNTQIRLVVMNFLIFAVWGAYLCSLGVYLGGVGLGANIGSFFAVQGIVSLFMPALMGIVADRWIPAQKLLGICHLLAAIFIALAGWQGMRYGADVTFGQLFPFYALSVVFFMPTIALGNSVSYNALTQAGMDTVKDYPPIRVFGTIGFIVSMWIVDLTGFKENYMQFFVSAAWGVVLGIYAFTLPDCPVNKAASSSFIDALGLRAFTLFKEKRMRQFFIFSFLLGMCLQVTNGFAATFLGDFGKDPAYADTFAVKHNIILSSISQISETLCILLIPFFLKRFGIKKVMVISFIAWFLRFAFFGLGNPGSGVWLFILSMIVYGVAFDFFNISGSLFVDKNTDPGIRSSAQGVFMMMTNGLGATIGSFCAQAVVNHFVYNPSAADPSFDLMGGWKVAWYIFAAFALVVGILFAIVFKYDHVKEEKI
jgi:NHS family xanthosine MFS transporter